MFVAFFHSVQDKQVLCICRQPCGSCCGAWLLIVSVLVCHEIRQHSQRVRFPFAAAK